MSKTDNSTSPKYDLNYFIEKFSSIPEELWTTRRFVDPANPQCKCAYGHCGERDDVDTPEEANTDVMPTYLTWVNDGEGGTLQYGDTPKERVVSYLKSLKK